MIDLTRFWDWLLNLGTRHRAAKLHRQSGRRARRDLRRRRKAAERIELSGGRLIK